MQTRTPRTPNRQSLNERDRAVRELTMFLVDSTGFRLGLANYDVAGTRALALLQAVANASEEGVYLSVLQLSAADQDVPLLKRLEDHLAGDQTPTGYRRAVAVTGIEAVMEAGARQIPPDRFAILHGANLQRDAFVNRCPVPVILWLNESSTAALAHEAPDLWHWRTGSFHFETEGESLESVVATTIGPAVAKFLMCHYLQVPAVSSGGLGEIAAQRVTNALLLRESVREFESLGDKVAGRLMPLLTDNIPVEIEPEYVVRVVAMRLTHPIAIENQTGHDLDPVWLANAFRAVALPAGTELSTEQQRLADRALDHVVRHLVNVASALPKFQVAVAKESLERLSRIGDDLDQVLETVQRIEQSVVKDSTNAAARYEADYRQAVIRKLDYLELFGADIPPEARTHSLSVAYVTLNLQRAGAKEDETTSLPVEDVLDELRHSSGRLLIRGEAGSGKSTLFRWAAIQSARSTLREIRFERVLPDGSDEVWKMGQALRRRRWDGMYIEIGDEVFDEVHNVESDWDYHIPFLIRLRDFTDGKIPSPDLFPELIAKEIGSPPANWVLSVLRAGRAIVLLDGVDEIPGAKREALRVEIKAIVDAYPQNYFLVSTRPQAVEEGWLAGEKFREATVNPMSDRDKSELIDKWHHAVGEELRRRGDHDPKLEGMAERLKGKLRETPSINLLAKYPLLAAMICAFHRRNNEHLPASEVELVERLCFMLLDDRDRLSGLRSEAVPDDYSKLEYRHKKLIVQDLAYHMLVHRGESSLTKEDALDQVRERLGRLGKPSDPQIILTAIVERSGMLREPVPGRIDFLHNAFKEYLTALRLVEENADGQLAGHWREAEWLPVILYAAATEKQGFATGLIEKLLTTGWKNRLKGRDPMAPVKTATRPKKSTKVDEEIRQRQVLALRCRRVAMDIDPALQVKLDKQRWALFPPQTLTDAEMLAGAGDLAVDELKFRPDYSANDRVACVRALRLIGTPKSLAALRGYFGETSRSILEELSQAVNPLEIPAVQEWIFKECDGTEWGQQAIRHRIVDVSPVLPILGRTVLNFFITQIDDTGLQLLARQAEHLTSVRVLDFGGTRVSDVGLQALIDQFEHLTSLESLNFGSTKVGDGGLRMLAAQVQHLSSLRVLGLGGTQVSDVGLQALAAQTRHLPALQSLNFADTRVSDVGLQALAAQAEHLRALQSLNFAYMRVSDVGLQALVAQAEHLPALQSLNFWGTRVSTVGLQALAEEMPWVNVHR